MKWETERVVEAAERLQARFLVEHAVELVDGEAAIAQEVEERAGSTEPERVPIGNALERREAHRRVDGAAVPHGGDRAAAAEMADDEPRHVDLLRHPLRRRARGSRSGGRPSSRQSRRERVRGALRPASSRGRRVEDRDVRDVRERLRGRARARSSAGRLWSGASSAPSSMSASSQSSIDRGLDERGRRRGRSGGRPRRRRRSSSTGVEPPSLVDERELEARRAGVDDEDVQPGHVQSRISGSSSPCSRV